MERPQGEKGIYPPLTPPRRGDWKNCSLIFLELGNTSGKTSTTKLRKYRLAESLVRCY